jgi:hypothetical protein
MAHLSRIRTYDPQLRRLPLCPAELQGHMNATHQNGKAGTLIFPGFLEGRIPIARSSFNPEWKPGY